MEIAGFLPDAGLFFSWGEKGLNLKPFRPRILQIKCYMDFVVHTRGQKSLPVAEQGQAVGLVKMDDGTGVQTMVLIWLHEPL